MKNTIFYKKDWIEMQQTRERGGEVRITISPQEINDVATVCNAASHAAGWYTDLSNGRPLTRNIPEMLCLIHSEISEAMEGYRKGLMDDKLPRRSAIEVELADAVIRILDLAGHLELDIGGAVIEKMKFNAQREDHKIENRVAAGGKTF